MTRSAGSQTGSTTDRASLVAEAYATLRQAIRDGVFGPGQPYSEQDIALELAMSRTPVHEALIRLQEDGLVRVLPKKGIVITALAPEDMREIYDVTIAIEAMAAELIAGLPDAERLSVADDLDAATQAMVAALDQDDREAWAVADAAFHRALVERCRNGRLRRIAGQIRDQAHRARLLTLKLRPKPAGSTQEHRQIIEAIRAGDASAAHRTARQHRVRARDELLPLIAQLGLRTL
jgi:DNA-binding GntR family transcriptional regulator